MSLAVFSMLAAASPCVRADLVLGFPNGLTGWSTAGDNGTVSAAGGLATIAESYNASETDLFLTFNVPSGASSLQFTLASVSPDSNVTDNTANGYAPDFFTASLLDPNLGTSLVPTVPTTADAFYTRDVVDGVTQGQAATGVTVTAPANAVALVSVDLSSLNLSGQSAEVFFRLVGGTDPQFASTVSLSDVVVVGAAAVPEPSSLLLSGLGIACCMGFYVARRLRGRRFEMA